MKLSIKIILLLLTQSVTLVLNWKMQNCGYRLNIDLRCPTKHKVNSPGREEARVPTLSEMHEEGHLLRALRKGRKGLGLLRICGERKCPPKRVALLGHVALLE